MTEDERHYAVYPDGRIERIIGHSRVPGWDAVFGPNGEVCVFKSRLGKTWSHVEQRNIHPGRTYWEVREDMVWIPGYMKEVSHD